MGQDEIHYVRISPGEPLPDLSSLAPFKAIVALHCSYSSNWQDEVSASLVAAGCRYMMAWGPAAATWDDSVDHAFLQANEYQDDDAKFVMTTWHDDETLEGVFWYAQFCGNFSYDDVELSRAVIVHVIERDRRDVLLKLYRRSRTLADRKTC